MRYFQLRTESVLKSTSDLCTEKNPTCRATIIAATSRGYQYVCPSVCLSGFFDHFPEVRSSRNRTCVCIFEKLVSGHRSRGRPKSGSTGAGDKLVIFVHFFVLFGTCPTVLIGECWKRIETFFGTLCRDLMRRNFEFLPSRSNIEGQRSNFEIRFWQP